MKRSLIVAASALFALCSLASAQDDPEKMRLSMMNGKMMVMGGGMTEGSEVMMGTNGAKPSDCPAGHFYTTDSSQQMVMACDDDAAYSLMAPESGAMMADGKPYPEGTMMMEPAKK